MQESKTARHNMLDSQIYTNKVEDQRVLAAIDIVPREEFVPQHLRGVAYIDQDLDIGDDRFLMEPMIFARLLQLADIQKTEKVLVVGSATGYTVAVIAALAKQVIGLENNINLISSAQSSMKKLGLGNASFVKAELTKGADRHKPFDVIFINGAVEDVPALVIAQLKDGGRIVTVKADKDLPNGPHHAVLIHKHGKVVSEQKQFQAFTTRLNEFNIKHGFEF